MKKSEAAQVSNNSYVTKSGAHISYLAESLPEVGEKKEKLLAATQEILEAFDIDESVFDNPQKAFVLTAIANRWTDAQTEEEWHYLHDAVTLVAHEHSALLESAYHDGQEGTGHELTPEQEMEIYDRYTNAQMTEAFSMKQDAIFAKIRERIGVTPENEDAFSVRVMNIASDYTLSGLRAKFDANTSFEESMMDKKNVDDWKRGLLDNSQAFAKELDQGEPPILWATVIGGKKYLCLDLPTAEKLIDEDVFAESLYPGSDAEKEKTDLEALAAHEYTHTQGGYLIDGETEFGIALEERRAEYFSGDKHGYKDIKRFLGDFEAIAGINLFEIFDKAPKGGDPAEVYQEIAAKIGLNATLELLMTYPNTYVTDGQTNTFMKESGKYLGSFDGFIGRLLESDLCKSRAVEIDEYISRRAKVFYDKDGEIDWVIEYAKGQGNNVISDLVKQRLEEMRQAA